MSLSLAVAVARNVLRIASAEVNSLPNFDVRASVQAEIDDLLSIVASLDRSTAPPDESREVIITEFILGTCQAIISHVVSEGEIGCKLFVPELVSA